MDGRQPSRAAIRAFAALGASVFLAGCGSTGGSGEEVTTTPGGIPGVVTTTTTTPGGIPVTGSYPRDRLSFAGRWFEGPSGSMVTGWGQSVTAKFANTKRVAITVEGQRLEGQPLGESYFSYRIDGGDWQALTVSNGTYPLAEDLDLGAHKLTFGKNDEALYGTWIFHELVVDEGARALQPDASKFKYSAIGDSITAGFRAKCKPLESATSCPSQDPTTENQYWAYPAALADLWGIDAWESISRSGIAVSIETNGHAEGRIIDQYECRVYSEDRCKGANDVKWDFAQASWQPDVITINLGTNDYVFGEPSLSTFQQRYKELVALVRSSNPDALIFCLCPLEFSLSPSPHWTTAKDGVEGAVKALNDPKIVYIPTGDITNPWMEGNTDYSDWTHPTREGALKLGQVLHEVLTPLIEQHLGTGAETSVSVAV